MNVGDALPPLRVVVRADVMPLWAVALRDPNPIHLDPVAVRALGLGDRVINQGPINVGYLVNMLAAAFPGSALEEIDVRFEANVFAGDVVVASGNIVAIRDSDRTTTIDCAIRLAIDDGTSALSGVATVSLTVCEPG